MAFTAADVKKLRDMTGVGMMDCKKALVETDGDMDKAMSWLREKGLAAAQKKAGRIAAEGIVTAIEENGIAVVLEINAETDFVAKNEMFQQFVADVAQVIIKENPASVEALMDCKYNESMTVAQAQQDKVLVIGENIKIRRFARYDSGLSIPYTHMGGRIGVIINMEVSDDIKSKPELIELGKDIAMQAAAMRPEYLDSSAVAQADLDKEREIQMTKALEENKAKNLPDDKAKMIAENMVKGRMNKFYEEMCLMNQPFVKENKISVEKHVEQVAKSLGGSIKVKAFTRFEKGEGIEKKEEDFAAEIASLVK